MALTLADLIKGARAIGLAPEDVVVHIETNGARVEAGPYSVGVLPNGRPVAVIEAPGPSVPLAIRQIEATREDLARVIATLRKRHE
jgi:hypothetical protein